MADSLALSVKEINLADQVAPKTNRVAYDAEVSNLRWFYHTFRSTANYYESCLLRDKLLALAKEQEQSPGKVTEANELYAQWRKVLLDEKENATRSHARDGGRHAAGFLLRLCRQCRPWQSPRR